MSFDDVRRQDKLRANPYDFNEREGMTYKPSRKLDERCAECGHPRNGRCPYLVEPTRRKTWPCFFMLYVEPKEAIEIPQGPTIADRKKVFGNPWS